MSAHTLSVAQLNRSISDALEGAFPGDVWVSGEIHGMGGSANGHLYFKLVEPGTLGRPTEATIGVALFRGNRRAVEHVLNKAGGLALADGLAVRIRGEVQYYAPQGRIQLRMTAIDPTHTLGRLAADREVLLRALAADGLLRRQRALPLAPVPLRVGLVTSAESAAAADVLHQFERSGVGWKITVVDTRVQGFGSAAHVAASLSVAARLPLDVVVLVRGGGSRTDLVAFDDEAVARTIATMPIPVLTGIGHEIDESVADHVAHRAFTTPTAAAAFLCDLVASYRARCDDLWLRLARRSIAVLDHADARLSAASARIAGGARRTVELSSARVERHSSSIATAPRRTLDVAERHVEALSREVRALDPARVVARGWSITRTDDGRLVRTLADAPVGATLRTTVADGTLVGTVTAALPGPADPLPEEPTDD